MDYERKWDKERVERVTKWLILKVYFEFVRNQRDQRTWEAGMEVMNQIPTK